MKCNKDLSECTCKDINERLKSVSNKGHFIYKMCLKCGKHYAQCECKDPVWGTSRDEIIKITEIAYPVWKVNAEWETETQLLPSGLKHDSTSFNISQREGEFDENGWWDKYKKPESKIIKLEKVLLGNFTWWMKWFCHVSLNYFDNEASAFASFEHFLEETYGDILKDKHDMVSSTKYMFLNKKTNQEDCIMGAEDTWRWKYCGCSICKEEQITIIKH